jgi:hypothetical protein
MSEERATVSIFDDAIARQFRFVAQILTVGYGNKKSPWVTAEDFEAAKNRQFQSLALLKTGRAADDEWQATITRQKFSDPVFNVDHWRGVAWIDRQPKFHNDPGETVLHLRHKDGGSIQIEPQRVAYDATTTKNPDAIEYGIIHAKKAWAGEAVSVNGDETFKATAWAFAQVHGVKVADYQPEGEALKVAQKIIADRQADEAKRPPNKPPNHGNPPLDLAA